MGYINNTRILNKKSQLTVALSLYGARCWLLESYHERWWIDEYIPKWWSTVQFMIDSIPLILRQTHVTVTSFHISCCAVLHTWKISPAILRLLISSLSYYIWSWISTSVSQFLNGMPAHLCSKKFLCALQVAQVSGMHESESVTNKEWADRTVRRLTYLHQFLFSIFYFQFPFYKTERPTDKPTWGGQRIIQKFKNYSKMLYGTTSSNSIFQSIFLSGWYYGKCRSSTTSGSPFLKFWRAASRIETEKQIKKAPKAKLRSFESYERSQLFDHLPTSTRQ